MSEEKASPVNFIRNIIEEDKKNPDTEKPVYTRFPPEPNGYLHIGHAKSIVLNFGLALDYQGKCNLRMDDTNPSKEEDEFVNSIIEDVKWLGYDWDDRLYFASDYFEKLYEIAVRLIKDNKAFVCELSPEEIREYRGTLTQPGKESPYRNRSIEENLKLFEEMKQGKYAEGTKTLRAKIDMASGNLNMRDPVIYRIMHTEHHRTGEVWKIYPMYDYAHVISDALEGITYSLCTLEFEDHRPLYNWFLENVSGLPGNPRQIEFARLNLTYTVLSKRKLLELVNTKLVNSWDDPRMPTIAGFRRRGYTPRAIRNFCNMIGVAKADNLVDIAMLEFALREDLNKTAMRAMVVTEPLKVVIENFSEDDVVWLDVENNPEDPEAGTRKVPFTKELYIEKGDFMENPPKNYFRLSPGKEVRLMKAFYVTCVGFTKDPITGEVTEVRCTYDPATKGGWSEDGRKVKGTSHWVSARYALNGEIRLYDTLFTRENPDNVEEGKDYKDYINPASLVVIDNAKMEPSLKEAKVGDNFQFLRIGYFCKDKDSSETKPVFNKAVGLQDTWAKLQKKGN
ncbi:MAG: glutamine--tRNA ligase/YqeY domain fusion protein [Leptospiraceae bacterium]|nr:glutamine--tRNA ligase/YqeY domain fusion protein [Leptospiraceae bacterium]MCP5499894.1 glutamine--tRNA ligase/YqeY domain fusion protein [Leptospiraceae bacterium]